MTQTPFEKLLKSKGLRTGFIADKLGMTPFMFGIEGKTLPIVLKQKKLNC